MGVQATRSCCEAGATRCLAGLVLPRELMLQRVHCLPVNHQARPPCAYTRTHLRSHLEDEGGVGWDDAAGAASAVCQA